MAWGVHLVQDIKEPLNVQTPTSQISILPRTKYQSKSKEKGTVLYAPVTVSLLAVVVLRCVLGLCTKREIKSAFPNQTPSVCIVDEKNIFAAVCRYNIVREKDRTYWPFWRYLSQRGEWTLNWRFVKRGPGAGAKDQRPKAGSARAPVVWDFAYGRSGGRGGPGA